MDARTLQNRTRRFAVRAVRFCRTLPVSWEARKIGSQLIDAATSVYANYRATCRARSRADFIAKLGVVAEEADECAGWLQLIEDLDLARGEERRWLAQESGELLAIFSASQKTAKANRDRPGGQIANTRKSTSGKSTTGESTGRKIDERKIDNRQSTIEN